MLKSAFNVFLNLLRVDQLKEKQEIEEGFGIYGVYVLEVS